VHHLGWLGKEGDGSFLQLSWVRRPPAQRMA
jgi:hypothetical protein